MNQYQVTLNVNNTTQLVVVKSINETLAKLKAINMFPYITKPEVLYIHTSS